MGKNYVNGKTFLEKRYDDNMELEDAVHTAILTLKEGFEGQVNCPHCTVFPNLNELGEQPTSDVVWVKRIFQVGDPCALPNSH